jgi:hypothetical protein
MVVVLLHQHVCMEMREACCPWDGCWRQRRRWPMLLHVLLRRVADLLLRRLLQDAMLQARWLLRHVLLLLLLLEVPVPVQLMQHLQMLQLLWPFSIPSCKVPATPLLLLLQLLSLTTIKPAFCSSSSRCCHCCTTPHSSYRAYRLW